MPGMSRVYLSNSGSEANEKAFKIVRQIGQLKHGGKKTGILYRARDYHGTTIGTRALAASSNVKFSTVPSLPVSMNSPTATSTAPSSAIAPTSV